MMVAKKSSFRKILDVFAKDEEIKWDHTGDEMIWVIPDQVLSKIKNADSIKIDKGERVLVFNKGAYQGTLAPGVSSNLRQFDKAIFVDVNPRQDRFAVLAPNQPLSKDRKSFGFSGFITFRVADTPESMGAFIERVVGNNDTFSPNLVTKWLSEGSLFQVFKEVSRDYTFDEFVNLERGDVDLEFKSRLDHELIGYGVEVLSIEIKYFGQPISF